MISEKKKAILASALTVTVAVLLLSYSGYAWLSMSKSVKAQGVNLDVSAPNNIQISLKNSTNNDDWSENVNVNLNDIVKAQIDGFSDTDKFFILPSSTYTGFNNEIFATNRAKTDGSTYDDTVFSPAHPIKLHQGSYEGHYIDVPLYFRNGGDKAISLYLAKQINGQPATYVVARDGSNIAKTARVAFLNSSCTATCLGGDKNQPLVYANDDHGVTPWVVTTQSPTAEDKLAPKYMTFTGNFSDQSLLTLLPADFNGDTIEYQVATLTLRIWIEGQDSNCVVSIGGKSFDLGFGFSANNIEN